MLSLASYFFWTTIAFELFFAIIQAQRELADAGLRSPYGDLSRLSFLPHQEHCDLRSPELWSHRYIQQNLVSSSTLERSWF
jgi:hypothetical protein